MSRIFSLNLIPSVLNELFKRIDSSKTAGLARTRCARACQTYVQFVAVNCGIDIHRHGVPRACILCALRRSRLCKVKSRQRAHQIHLRALFLRAATALCPVMQPADVVDSTSAGELSAEGDVCLCGLLVLDLLGDLPVSFRQIYSCMTAGSPTKLKLDSLCNHNIHNPHQLLLFSRCDLQDFK